MNAPAVGVLPVGLERVVDDGGERAEVGQDGPEAVMEGEMGGVELAGAAGPEAFAGVVLVPDVEVALKMHSQVNKPLHVLWSLFGRVLGEIEMRGRENVRTRE